ncbi:MAG TPA: hypothetical protein PKY35_09980 [Candidatus Hydrogenedentes bacterium]|nr:hypothetical protein [Candidatus Hydrogenedentota bacterium]HOL77348.1 hypothetical protein [Candidatus Hydrogenedentota bacterium]HPO84834.1 hypothetical protein [Candidatus Hydrogenedentota bacterium]
MEQSKLFSIRLALLQSFLLQNGYDGILLSRSDNYAMATGGRRNFIYTYSDVGANSLFVTKEGKAVFVGNTIESPRQRDEELFDLPCEAPIEFLWFADSAANAVRKKFAGNFVSDDGSLGPNVNGDLARLRAALTTYELEKYRHLGKLAAEAMCETLKSISTGMTEADIAARLVAEGWKRQCHVPVVLVAADERIARYRHPLPTVTPLLSNHASQNCVRTYVMVVGCFLREGLVVSLTRFKKVREVSKEIHDAYCRICGVDALVQEATLPGKTLGDVFAACQQAYPALGFSVNEWHHHHQGGATGYAGRTCKGAPGESFPIVDPQWSKDVKNVLGEEVPFGMAFAWNPSAPGVKSEDTFILLPDGTKEIVTATPMLPQVDLAKVLGRNTEVGKSDISC